MKKPLILSLFLCVILCSVGTNGFENTTRNNTDLALVEVAIPSDSGYISEGEGVYYSFSISDSPASLEVELSGPYGTDFDLYLARGYEPDLNNYDYSSTSYSSEESIYVSSPNNGEWFILIYAYSGSGTYYIYVYTTPANTAPTSTQPPATTTTQDESTSQTQDSTDSTSEQSTENTLPGQSLNPVASFGMSFLMFLGVFGFLFLGYKWNKRSIQKEKERESAGFMPTRSSSQSYESRSYDSKDYYYSSDESKRHESKDYYYSSDEPQRPQESPSSQRDYYRESSDNFGLGPRLCHKCEKLYPGSEITIVNGMLVCRECLRSWER